MRAMDSRRDFTSKKVFSGYFSELGEKANSALLLEILLTSNKFLAIQTFYILLGIRKAEDKVRKS